jgi:prevent-host-death family protein
MGLREAKQSFSKAIKAVKAGKDVILTERGKPIAVIKGVGTRDECGCHSAPPGSRRALATPPEERKADADLAFASAH